MDSNRIFQPLLWLLIVAGAFFGLASFIAPSTFASLTGFAGTDQFTYRLAGAATFAYAVGLVAGTRASWVELRIPIASTLVFNAASIFACVFAIITGGAQPIVFVILLASVVFTAGTWQLIQQPPLAVAGKARAELERPIASWLVALYVIGVAAAAAFGLGPLLLGGQFGVLLGASGDDSFVYRQAGAATLGAAMGGILVLQSRRWSATRLPTLMAVTFNGLSVIAAIVELIRGGPPVAWLILAAAGVTTLGMGLALARKGR